MQTSRIRKYNTDIHIIKFGNEIRLDTTLGVPQKREDIRFMFGNPRPDEVTALRFNLSFFVMNNHKSEEMCVGRGDAHVNVAYDGEQLYFEPDIPDKPMLWEVASSYMLLRNGQRDNLGQDKLKHLLGSGPRTIWGQDGKGNKYAIIVEGRKWNQKGLNANEQYELVRQMGLKDAITADGGGSSVAFVYDTQIGKVWDGRYHGRIMVGYSKYTLSQLPNLKKGARGVYVNLMQRLLKINPDGKYGGQTVAAVKEYQRQHRLKIDGKCGPQTWKSLTRGVIW
jgi:peptidoglycan hydrolase-like protein with peptidoglycan-binding domain